MVKAAAAATAANAKLKRQLHMSGSNMNSSKQSSGSTASIKSFFGTKRSLAEMDNAVDDPEINIGQSFDNDSDNEHEHDGDRNDEQIEEYLAADESEDVVEVVDEEHNEEDESIDIQVE